METLFYGENEKSFFKLDDLQKNRTLLKPFYPSNNIDCLDKKRKTKTNKKNEKQNGEKRILSIDAAMMGRILPLL